MAIYDGYKAAQEHLVEVAKACAVAAARAPSLTGKLGLQMEIITGDDLKPMMGLLEKLGEASMFQRVDATTYRKLLDAGRLPPVLLLGADLTEAINWNCGGCGFPTCAEFIKYLRRNKGVGIGAYGPSCLWKVVDLGIAADHACACAAMHRVEVRIQFSMGACSMFLDRLEGCSFVLALPLGPVGSDIWFDRQSWQGEADYQTLRQIVIRGGPNLAMGFTGGGPPIMKTKQRWWENPQFMKIEKDDEIVEKAVENQAAAYEIVMRHAGVLDEENIPSDQD
jgi:uncharacterized ferredoxin-like protein